MPDLNRLTAALADRYAVERELGRGGMATVYLARDRKHDREVALKVLRPEIAAVLGAERFLREIRTTAHLQHPHILPLHDSGEAEGYVFYVMPYVEGESLRDRLERETQLPVDEAVRIARDVASALDYAHRHGVVHRDVKPANILLEEGQALVADFGIALAVSRSERPARITESGVSLGTPHYMSPEQAMGERDLGPSADVYALGCVTYEMLVGTPPFTGATAQAVVAQALTESPHGLTRQRHTIPPHVEAAVLKALEKLPADRFATAAQFAEALAVPALMAAATSPVSRSAGPPVRRSVVTPVLAAATLLLAALAAWGWLRGGNAELPVAWHRVTLGDSAVPATTYTAMALSPDGSMLAFKDDHQNGRLWVKRRDHLEPTSIPGTERAQNPVFSPDGAWIGYVADGGLHKVRSAGGPTVLLADSVVNFDGGPAWLDDGTLIYVDAAATGLRRVSADGGPGAPALRDTVPAGTVLGAPVALPGACGVLFQACASGCAAMSVHVLDLATGRSKPLLHDVAQAWPLPDGRLLYVRGDGVAMAAPFDLDRLEITGEATPVLAGVHVGRGFASLAVSAGGTLVYVRERAGPETMLVRVGRGGSTAPLDTAFHGQFGALALSPDGRRVAVGLTAPAANIWLKELERGPLTRLTFGNRDRRPAWSPDGRLVAFIRDSGATSAVYARPADGGGPERLLARIDRMVQGFTWSPDGRWLILRTNNYESGAGDLVGVRTDGAAPPVPLAATGFTELHPAVSPDGRWLAYTSNESGSNEVYVQPFPDAGAARWQVSNGGGASPVWSPRGDELFYLDPDRRLVAAAVRAGRTFAVAGVRPLFDASGLALDAFHQNYAVAPDGRSFVFLQPERAGGAPAPEVVWVDRWLGSLTRRSDR
jgi:serine/threonine-protein kinase